MLNILSSITQIPIPADPLSGGTLYQSGGYKYRVFTASGSLIASGSVTADVMVVAGGAGGGNYTGDADGKAGGGGAGGFRVLTSQTITGTNTVTIGAGGAQYANGGNTSCGSISATGGGKGGSDQGDLSSSSGGCGGGASAYVGYNITGGAGNAGPNPQGGRRRLQVYQRRQGQKQRQEAHGFWSSRV